MTCATCEDERIVMLDRPHYRPCRDCCGAGCGMCDRTGHRLYDGPVTDACPACTAHAEAEWQALTLPMAERIAAE